MNWGWGRGKLRGGCAVVVVATALRESLDSALVSMLQQFLTGRSHSMSKPAGPAASLLSTLQQRQDREAPSSETCALRS